MLNTIHMFTHILRKGIEDLAMEAKASNGRVGKAIQGKGSRLISRNRQHKHVVWLHAATHD
jgi:hypothetical protein